MTQKLANNHGVAFGGSREESRRAALRTKR